MTKTEQALMELSKKHCEYVETLKKSLILGQLGFLKAGEALSKIKADKTYEAEDSSHRWTWENFLARPDLPLPGSTPQSQIRTAQILIQIYRLFVKKLEKPQEELAEIGQSRLSLIAGPIKKVEGDVKVNAKTQGEADQETDEWYDKAKILGWKDLYAEIKGSGKEEIGAGLQCDHQLETLMWVCPTCGMKAGADKPMDDKHKDVKIDYGK